MGFSTGDDDLVDKVEPPVHTNPIQDEVVLAPKVEEHVVHSVEMIENKRTWFEDLTQDMYHESIPEITGSRVYAEFFSSLIAADTPTSPSSSLISAVHREYLSINNYPLYFDGELNTSTDAQSQKTDTESELTIHGVLPPQTSDYFVIRTGGNRRSVFRVKSARPLSIYADRAYAVTYIMEEPEVGELYADLVKKTVRRLNYVRENHQLGLKYLLTDDEVRIAAEQRATFDTAYNTYVAEFYDRDLKVFSVQGKEGPHTDMIIQGFMKIIGNAPDDMYYYEEYDETVSLKTIFDVLLYMDTSLLPNVMDKVSYYLLTSPTEIGAIHPVLLSPIKTMPFQRSSRMMKCRLPNLITSTVHDYGSYIIPETTICEIFENVQPSNMMEFPNVLRNETYILGEKFYSGAYGCLLEELLFNAIRRQPIPHEKIIDLISKAYMLEPEERYFIMPLVMVLLKLKEH